MKRIAKLFLMFLFLNVIPFLVNAQPTGTCDNGYDPGCSPDDPCPCPIDSGLVLLILVAVGLSALHAYRKRVRVAL